MVVKRIFVPMKTKVTFIILIAIAVGLGVGLISLKNQANEQHQTDVEKILSNSNEWVHTTALLDDQQQKNLALEKEMTARKTELAKLSNDLSQTSESLSKTETALKTAMEENAKRDAKINELESQNQTLDKQAVDLKGSIASLETQISATEKKLATSEGDKAFLQKELKRLIAEKTELERQFNDLAVLRAQVHKIKDELSIARRLEWIREGLFASEEQKGAQKLMQGFSAGVTRPPLSTNKYDLNVEVKSDGTVTVIAPLTNAPVPPPQAPAKQ